MSIFVRKKLVQTKQTEQCIRPQDIHIPLVTVSDHMYSSIVAPNLRCLQTSASGNKEIFDLILVFAHINARL